MRAEEAASYSATAVSSKEERALKKAQEAEERRLKREIERLETEIETLETRLSEIEEIMARPENAADFSKLSKLSSEMTEIKEKINICYEKWEDLQSDS